MKKLAFFALTGMILWSCSNSTQQKATTEQPQQNKVEITNDIENALAGIPSWGYTNGIVSMKQPAAHSGTYACLTTDTLEYSYSYSEIFKNLNKGLPKSVTVSGWVYSTVASPNFSIICDISENQKGYQWKAFPITESVKETGKWFEFTSSFLFDKPLNPDQLVHIFAWNQAKKPIYLDDLKLTFEY